MSKLETSQCRSCGALIYWIETRNGKRMPVDTGRESLVVVDADGRDGHVVHGFRSHFVTCPNADKHRKSQ